jgi:putative ABC transport system permease protein
MLRNHFRIALPNLMKYKFISFINLFGLTLGLICCLLILIYILHDLSFDWYNANADRIYRVTRIFNNQNGLVSIRLRTIAPPFGPLLQNDFPDIHTYRMVDNPYLTKGFRLSDFYPCRNISHGRFPCNILP